MYACKLDMTTAALLYSVTEISRWLRRHSKEKTKHKKVELYLGKNVAADLCLKKFNEAKVSLKFSSSVDILN